MTFRYLADPVILTDYHGEGGRPCTAAIECDPAIITLPRVSTSSLQDLAASPVAEPGYPQPSP